MDSLILHKSYLNYGYHGYYRPCSHLPILFMFTTATNLIQYLLAVLNGSGNSVRMCSLDIDFSFY